MTSGILRSGTPASAYLTIFCARYGDHFDHNLQALRIVEQFEQRYLDFPGINLTFEVREGIVKHSHDYDAVENPELAEYLLDQRPPLEAQLIDFVDEIAYNTADLDDGYESRLLSIDMICSEVPLFARFYEEVNRSHPQGPAKLKFNEAAKRVLDELATGLIQHTQSAVQSSGVRTVDDVRQQPRRLAGFDASLSAENAALKKFLQARLYENPGIVGERERSVESLAELFNFYMAHPEKMPKSYAELASRSPKHRVVCDYIAGMTDHFLLRLHGELTGPESARST